VCFALIGIALVAAQAYVRTALERDLALPNREQVLVLARMVAAAVEQNAAFEPAQAHALVRAMAGPARARVTLVAPHGRTVADSNAEVRAGPEDERRAAASVSIHGPRGETWVVRVEVGPRRIEASRGALERLLLGGAFLGLLAAAILSTLAVQFLARPMRQLTATAREMLTNLRVRAPEAGRDEMGDLSRALNELVVSLARSIENLGDERDQLGAILEAMAEGVLVTGDNGTIVVANRAARSMFHVGPEVLGRTPRDSIAAPEIVELIERVARDRTPSSGELSVGPLGSAQIIARLAPLGDDGQGAVAVLTDVTELRRLERVRRDFVANVSHELRTPIAAVRAAAETLQTGAIDQPATAREFVAIIDRHAERLHELVEDLLELSRIEAKEVRLNLEPVAAVEAATKAAELFRLAAERGGASLELPTSTSHLHVLADRRALERVLSNLVDNAIKYSGERPTIRLEVSARNKFVRFSVHNTGPGIDAEHLPRLFERFYRVDAGRSRQLGGTGLGLAIVKHLVEAMGGTVSVESAMRTGTTFHVDLPRAAG